MINVTCAIIRNEEDEVLTVQRGEKSDHPYLWEFPGGKINDGESEEECVIREISEELSMDIIICGTLLPVEYDYGHKHIKLIPFICDTLDELPLLTEHIAFKWLSAEKLMTVDYCEADELIAKQYFEFVKKIYAPPEKASAVSQYSFDDQDLQSMINRMMGAKDSEGTDPQES